MTVGEEPSVAELRRELAEVRAGYHALDENWERHHEACMAAIRGELGMSEGALFEILIAIRELKARHG